MTTTNEHTERAELKPCPFCGHTGLDFSEGCKEQWMAEALIEDLAEWSRYVDEDHAHQTLEKHVRDVLEKHGIKGKS